MNSPLVSVILPNYNYGRFISESIQSILNQSYPHFEVWIVDDGSTDNSPEIIKLWSSQFPHKINSVLSEKKGLSSARNKGLSLCRGDIITFLDSDDIWSADYLLNIVTYFKENPSSNAVYANAELFDSQTGKVLGGWFGPNSNRRIFSGNVSKKLFLHGNFIPICTAAVRRNVLSIVNGFDEKFHVAEDLDFWMRVSMNHSIDYIDRKLCQIRRHGANASFLPTNAHHVLRVYKKNIEKFPEISESLSAYDLQNRWSQIYYEIGRQLTLRGERKRARLYFRKALCHWPDVFAKKFWLYYPLTYFSYVRQILKFRLELVKIRRRFFCAAD